MSRWHATSPRPITTPPVTKLLARGCLFKTESYACTNRAGALVAAPSPKRKGDEDEHKGFASAPGISTNEVTRSKKTVNAEATPGEWLIITKQEKGPTAHPSVGPRNALS